MMRIKRYLGDALDERLPDHSRLTGILQRLGVSISERSQVSRVGRGDPATGQASNSASCSSTSPTNSATVAASKAKRAPAAAKSSGKGRVPPRARARR